jgi:arsenite oxidase large subunit
MVQPEPTAKREETFTPFGYPTGSQGDVVDSGVNELIIPNYRQAWGNIRKIATAPEALQGLTFKSWEYRAG